LILHKEELRYLYRSPTTVRIVKYRRLLWAGEATNEYRIFEGKPHVIRLLGRPKRRWDDKSKMNISEMGCEDGKWMELAERRVQRRVLVLFVLRFRVVLAGTSVGWSVTESR